jgi:hypothetical protein
MERRGCPPRRAGGYLADKSRRDDRAIRREVGLATGLWYWRELKDLGTELGWAEEPRVVSIATHPPIIWAFEDSHELDRMGWLMATNTRLIFLSRRGPKRRVALPIGSIRGVGAERFGEPFVLTVQTENESVVFGIHANWPKRRAKTALTAFVDQLSQEQPEAARPLE